MNTCFVEFYGIVVDEQSLSKFGYGFPEKASRVFSFLFPLQLSQCLYNFNSVY